jgi:hypothetical protein
VAQGEVGIRGFQHQHTSFFKVPNKFLESLAGILKVLYHIPQGNRVIGLCRPLLREPDRELAFSLSIPGNLWRDLNTVSLPATLQGALNEGPDPAAVVQQSPPRKLDLKPIQILIKLAAHSMLNLRKSVHCEVATRPASGPIVVPERVREVQKLALSTPHQGASRAVLVDNLQGTSPAEIALFHPRSHHLI